MPKLYLSYTHGYAHTFPQGVYKLCKTQSTSYNYSKISVDNQVKSTLI